MSYLDLWKSYNEEVTERYELVIERISKIKDEETTEEPYRDYFHHMADMIIKVDKIQSDLKNKTFFNKTLSEIQQINKILYEEIKQDKYGESYGNPTYAVKKLGDPYGKILSFLYSELTAIIPYTFMQRTYNITILCELFVELYNCFEDDVTEQQLTEIIYWYFNDYCEVFMEINVLEQVNPEMDFYTDIIMNADLTNPKYLYRYGKYITENETGIYEFLSQMSEQEIQSMADTYTEGYRIGFEVTGKDLSIKKTVELIYPIGFERMMRMAVKNFEKMGLKPVCRNVDSTSPNRQFEYDHKSDRSLYFDKKYVERRLECTKNAYEKNKKLASYYAGPAVVEVFGEKTFDPKNIPEAYQYNEEQQKLNVYLANTGGRLVNQYIKGEERSFTIIAYPIPEIGPDFKKIFAKTVEVNTLDYQQYSTMQQKIIDVLDQGEFVHITGKGKNKTDLKIALYPLKDADKETKFENCVADVNIPVGEVFTSPVLKGTNGILHVTQVFLKGLQYTDLELEFKDGMINSYSCKNFENDEENSKFIKEELLHHHDTLPMGEFAIGTNTTAYKMGKEFKIADKLPILIAEKTGPHFAVGDTCYNREEDAYVCNPNGKQIVARENEISRQRKTDETKAYFNCHTDITIPYDELDKITVIRKDQSTQDIISDGKFVVKGTENLNKPLEELE